MLRSVKTSDYMSDKFIKIDLHADIFDAINTLLEYKIAAMPVVGKDGVLQGIISEVNCLEAILTLTYHEEEQGGKVSDYMSKEITTMAIDTDIIKISKAIIENDLYCLPITENGKLVGQISRSDVLRIVEGFAQSN